MTTAAEQPGPWQALHVFYAANPRPLLLNCVRPLFAELAADGLSTGHFFINYWLEGPHVRVRVRPASDAAVEPVRTRMAEAVSAFLRARPALYEVDSGFLHELYDTLFALEFSGAERARFTGPDGRMVLRPNNSHSFEPYEPEYGKYGGLAGVDLAEWHFRHSTDLVIDALAGMNLHLRSVQLGLCAQLMLVLAGTFLPDRGELAEYFDRYHVFWHRAFAGTDLIGTDEYARAYDRSAEALPARSARVLDALTGDRADRLPAPLDTWAAHARRLRAAVVSAAVRGALEFRSWDGTADEVVTDPADALQRLLSPYLHMTNNRLNATIRDEAYLSYALARAVRVGSAV
ncbi:lantibiotic dehydratase C-terminal domain-containing protein [Actinokineospora auranticolor]|uniref:Thiopeptide-type bacteriocin biosynthesis protein n=1 Tax=Actinokineospora auranticolor TaxID=155976 RepID=A0A2S6GER3_9PSEU|nr:lantibiotic dehydratase C-terminal domain-containing protein [Actinokineospora auranticolor]PPK63727.1 thiopeptide-type bacteriocin biosynthesis protein [Actinokineospora auranticolor]